MRTLTDIEREMSREIGARIKAERKARGMRMEDLAETLGLSFQQVQKYETGKNRVSAPILKRIADALGVPVATFFEDAAA